MSIQVVKIKNIPIKLHFTLIIVFFLVAWTLTVNFMPRIFPGLGVYHYWIMGVSGAIILFISVLAHELAHSIISLRHGVKVDQIILFIFGGVSDIKEEPKDSNKEFKIAIVGPLASFTIAGLFAAFSWGLLQVGGEAASPMFTSLEVGEDDEISTFEGRTAAGQQTAEVLQYTGLQTIIIRIISGIMIYGVIINILLGTFNLLPAFPLDGGRILRAVLYRWKRNHDYATRVAVRVGTGISYGVMGVGFISLLTGSFIGGFWLILIGWFLQSGAQAYLQQYELSNLLSKARLKDIMKTVYTSVSPNISIKELINDFFNIYRKSEFPVIDPGKGRLLGSVTTKQAISVADDVLNNIKVRDIMTPVTELVIMSQNDHAYEALTRMYKDNKSRVYVCSDEYLYRYSKDTGDIREGYKIIGIISKTDILNVVSENQEYMHNLAKAGKR
ncbi:MAG: site-2 protease family protein [Nitrososphaeraceae archaeon]